MSILLSSLRNRRLLRMWLTQQIIFKMALKSGTSDFSIDHILNRAGDQYSKNKQCEIFETISMTSSPSSSCDESVNCDNYEKKICHNGCGDSERFMEIPTFDWLNYTRYNMPRMPRPTKGPARRTPGRLPRIPFTPYQLNELENAYKTATYLSTEDANKLAKRLDLTGVRVKIWFQNRRARDRRERKDLSLNKSLKKPSDEEEEIIVN